MTVILLLLLLAQSAITFLSIRKNLELMETIEETAENYEEFTKEVLEQLSYYYNKIDKKSKLELFLDEPVTRELVEDIKGTKKAIRNAAEKISVFIEEENDEKES
jgi:hypothetical protein